MKKIIFICRRNIFRSQVAKGFCDQMSRGKVTTESYGTKVESEGNSGILISHFPGMLDTINILKKDGIDISNEKCKQITPKDLIGAEKIIVMAEREYIPEWLNEYNFEYWDISYSQDINSEYPDNITYILETLRKKVALLLKKNYIIT